MMGYICRMYRLELIAREAEREKKREKEDTEAWG